MSKSENTPITLTFKHVAVSKTDSPLYVYEGPDGEDRTYARVLGGGRGTPSPGSVYDGAMNDEGQAFINLFKFVRHSDDKRIPEWVLLHDAALSEIAGVKQEKKGGALSDEALAACLRPIKRAMNKAINRRQRNLIIARVLEEISKP